MNRPSLRSLADALGLDRAVGAALCACPRCASRNVWPELALDDDWSLYCATCGWTGPTVPPDAPVEDALAAWNREARQVAEARALGLRLCFMQPPPSAEAAA